LNTTPPLHRTPAWLAISLPAAARAARLGKMARVVLRVRLIGGERLDVTYEDARLGSPEEVLEHVLGTLAHDSGALHAEHGDRLMVLYGRGVAAVEVAPRGAVL
jgi:hypothetical protein